VTHPTDWLTLRSTSWTAAIDPHGAQLSILRDAAGQDLLWDGDPAFWSGRSPLLFPIVGALNDGHFQWRGKRFALPRHGLARTRRFNLLHAGENEAAFRLQADASTLLVYPFHFELDVIYRLDGDAFEMQAIVRNAGGEPMPASIGFHPAFRWPLSSASRDAHRITFEHDEPAPIRRLDAHGLLTQASHPTPVRGRQLALDDSLFRDDVLIFDQLRSRQLRYGAEPATNAEPGLMIEFDGATHLGLWTRPGAGFLCIEPWRGVADPVGFTGEFDTKPGVFVVPAGGTQSLQMRLRRRSVR
jgi:galactose mutarotase-like enzyme